MKDKDKDRERETERRRPRKVGACRVLSEVGRGGMARVYRGVHELLQREVAIKELLPEAMVDKESLSRFKREALALAGFRHQNIVTLYDLIEKDASLYMVMEFVDGPTLGELLREGPLPPEVAAVIGARLCSALDHAHFSRIIHRDLKPSNVMITLAGEVKLMDFGIAKDEGLDALTREGMAVGTPSYMSPEQVGGGDLDARTDIFSLGVVLYECLSGARPFVGANAGEMFARIRMGKHKPLAKAAPHVPRALRNIVKKAMRTKIPDRYEDAAAMKRDLEAYLAKSVRISHAALLLAFLRHRNRISETAALARLTSNELAVIPTFEKPPPAVANRWRRLKWAGLALVAAAALGTAGYFSRSLWLTRLPLLSGKAATSTSPAPSEPRKPAREPGAPQTPIRPARQLP